MANGILLLMLTTVFWGIGYRILSSVSIDSIDAWERDLLAIGLGLGSTCLIILALGTLGWIDAVSAWAFVIAGGLWGMPLLITRLRKITAGGLTRYVGLRLSACLTLIGFCGLLNFLGALAPISSADALSYHFAMAKAYVRAGRIIETPWSLESYGPSNIQMLYLLGMLLYEDILGVLFHWLLGLLLVGAIVALARRYLRGPEAIMAAAIFYVSGLIAWESTSGYVDLGLAFFTLLAFLSLIAWKEGGGEGWLILAGIFSGFAAGTKLTGIIIPLLVGLEVLLAQRGKAGGTLLRFGMPAALVLGPWVLRSALYTGNPFYPFLTPTFGGPDTTQWISQTMTLPGYGKSLKDLILLPFNLTFRGTAFDRGELLGPLYLAFCPFAWRSPIVKALWRPILLFFLVWFYTSQQVRLLLPVVPLLALWAAQGYTHLGARGRITQVTTRVTLAAGLLFGIGVTAVYNVQFLPVVLGREPRADFLARKVLYYPEIRWMNEHLPPASRVCLQTRMPYYLDRPFGLWTGGPLDRLRIEQLRGEGYTHFFVTNAGDLQQLRRLGLRELYANRSRLPISRTLGTFQWTETAIFALEETRIKRPSAEHRAG